MAVRRLSASAAVTTSETTVLSVTGLTGEGVGAFEIVAAGDALNQFAVQCQAHESAAWYDFLENTDFLSTDISNLLFCSTQAPYDLADGETSQFQIRLNGVYAVRLRATSTGSTTLTVQGSVMTR